jgi:hypothetical protein
MEGFTREGRRQYLMPVRRSLRLCHVLSLYRQGYRALEVVKELLLTGPARTGSQQRDDRRNQPSGVNQRWSLTLPANASTSLEIASVLIWWRRDYTPHL